MNFNPLKKDIYKNNTQKVRLLRHRQHVVSQSLVHLVEALRYKPAGRGFDPRWSHWNFLLT